MTSPKFKNKYRTKTCRLAGYDYSSNGAYFITICTQDRLPYFGNVKNGKMILSPIGKMADQKPTNLVPNHKIWHRLCVGSKLALKNGRQ